MDYNMVIDLLEKCRERRKEIENTFYQMVNYSDDIPEIVLPFVDWEAFFKKYELDIEDVLPGGDSIIFNGQCYYYGDI